MDDQRTDREGGGSINRVALGLTIFLAAFFLIPIAESHGATTMSIATLALLIGGAIVGSGALKPFGLARLGAALGFVLLLATLLFFAAMTMGK